MTASGGAAAEGPMLVPLLNVLLRHRRLAAGLGLGLCASVLIISLLLPRTYTASASFSPQSTANVLSQLTGLAAQFGVGVPTGEDVTQSPQFYADLLGSGQLLRGLVETTYAFVDRGDTVRANLIKVYDIDEGSYERSREEAVRVLDRHVNVSTDLKTGVVTLSVDTRIPELSKQIAERALELLNAFNLQTRQSQGGAQRRFIEGRVQTTQTELREAEDRLQRFLQANRDFSNSPQLQFERDRLQRDVQTRQEVYTTLLQSYEQARIDEVRNTPVITIVEQPILPARPDRRHLALKGLLALFIGLFVGGLAAMWKELVQETEVEAPDQFDEFRRLRGAALADLRRPWRALRSGHPS